MKGKSVPQEGPPGVGSSQSKSGNTDIKLSAKSSIREPGFRNLDSTAAFRAINPELFVKPNKVVMATGLAAIVGCMAYIGYMNLKTDKTKETYMALDEQDKLERRYRGSRWD